MKTFITLMLFSSIAFAGLFSEDKLEINNSYEVDGIIYSKEDNEPFDGLLYEQGRTIMSVLFRVEVDDGVYDGRFERLTNDGTVIEQGEYDDGELDGTIRNWYSSGELQAVMEYDEGEIEEQTEYHKNGRIKAEAEFEDGTLVEYVKYRSSGRVAQKVEKRNGQLYLFKYYDREDLPLSEEYSYTDIFVKNGRYKRYHLDGKVEVESDYKDNKQHGEYIVNHYHKGELFQRDTRFFIEGEELHDKQVVENF